MAFGKVVYGEITGLLKIYTNKKDNIKMKKQISMMMALTVFATVAFAQNTSFTKTSTVGAEENFVSQGVRVAVVKPFYSYKFKYSGFFDGESKTYHMDSTTGVSVGYANLPVQEVGWTANAAYLFMTDKDNDLGSSSLARVEGNIAYAISKNVNIKGGLNLAKFTSGSLKELDAGAGIQGSVGVQVNKNLGFDVGITATSLSKKYSVLSSDDEKVDFIISGIEVGLNATF